MRNFWLATLFILVVVGAWYLLFRSQPVIVENGQLNELDSLIQVATPRSGATITGRELVVSGAARGNWFFEASFPLVVVDASGQLVAQGHAEAESDWMTTDFVPFRGTLILPALGPARPLKLILKRDNPSGLPANDQELVIPFISS